MTVNFHHFSNSNPPSSTLYILFCERPEWTEFDIDCRMPCARNQTSCRQVSSKKTKNVAVCKVLAGGERNVAARVRVVGFFLKTPVVELV